MPVQDEPVTMGEPLFECVDCGRRVEEPDGRLCTCGGYLQNIGVPRAQ
jgi:hypothetical protein